MVRRLLPEEEKRKKEGGDKMENKNQNRVQSIVAHVLLIILSFMCLFFFYILIINATRSHAQLQKGFSALPGGHFWENLKNVANDGTFPMIRGIFNSLLVSGCSAALSTYFSSLTAYGLYTYDFKLRKAAFTFIMAILVMPTQVTAMGFLRLVTKIGMYDSLLPLIIPSIASPAVFYFMYSYLQSSLPLSLVEAARIDGMSEYRIYASIMLPLSKPALSTLTIFTFVNTWNDYLGPLIYLKTETKKTIQLGLKMFIGQFSAEYGLIMAGSIITLIPVLIIFLCLQKYFVEGVASTGLKG